jgi:type IX secretion system PorP/SprF family membrane protein
MKGIVFVVFLSISAVVSGQSLARYNLYPYNADFANPAATGMSGCLEITGTDLHQWIGIKDAPNLQSLSLQKGGPFRKKKKYGIGMNLVRDINGPTKYYEGELLYSFHFAVNRTHKTWLSLGLSGNIGQYQLHENEFSPVYDPLVTGTIDRELVYNASFGVFLYNGNYFAGAAVYNLLPVQTAFDLGYGSERYYASFQGGRLFDNRNWRFRLQSSIQGNIGRKTVQVDLSNRFLFDNNLWAGITLRKFMGVFETSGQNVLLSIGYNWYHWNFSYGYNFDINGTAFHHFGTHQLSLGYKLCPSEFLCPAY